MAPESTARGAARTIKASEFKAKCLKLMDEVADSGEEIIITKRGRPVAKLTPCRETPKIMVRVRPGHHQDPRRHHGPRGVEWEAEADPDRVLHP